MIAVVPENEFSIVSPELPLAVAVGVAGQSGIISEVQCVHANHLGTPILTTNAAGQAVTPYGYAANFLST